MKKMYIHKIGKTINDEFTLSIRIAQMINCQQVTIGFRPVTLVRCLANHRLRSRTCSHAYQESPELLIYLGYGIHSHFSFCSSCYLMPWSRQPFQIAWALRFSLIYPRPSFMEFGHFPFLRGRYSFFQARWHFEIGSGSRFSRSYSFDFAHRRPSEHSYSPKIVDYYSLQSFSFWFEFELDPLQLSISY